MGDLATLPTFQPAPTGYTAADFNAIFAALTIKAGAVNANAIADASITLAKLAAIAANSFLGNNTAGALTPLALTINQARTLLALPPTDAASNNGLYLNVPSGAGYGHLTLGINGLGCSQLVSTSVDVTNLYIGAEFTGGALIARHPNPVRIFSGLSGGTTGGGQLVVQSDSAVPLGGVWTPSAPRLSYDVDTGHVNFYGPPTPKQGQVTINSSVAAGINFLCYQPGHNQIFMGAEFIGGSVVARHTAAVRFFDQGNGNLLMSGDIGLTAGNPWSPTTRFTFDYSAGIFTANGGIISNALVTGTVLDGQVGSKWRGATGELRLTPYYSSTYGVLLESMNTAETVLLPITVSGSNIILRVNNTDIGTVTTAGIGANAFNATSARRFKKNVQPLEAPAALDIVRHLRPVIYDEQREDGRRNLVGFIAEEMQEVLPGMVTRDEHGKAEAINYGPLVAVVAAAIKELTGRLDRLERSAA